MYSLKAHIEIPYDAMLLMLGHMVGPAFEALHHEVWKFYHFFEDLCIVPDKRHLSHFRERNWCVNASCPYWKVETPAMFTEKVTLSNNVKEFKKSSQLEHASIAVPAQFKLWYFVFQAYFRQIFDRSSNNMSNRLYNNITEWYW